MLNIVACIKQVPSVTEVKWDPDTGSLIRKGVPSIINPSDKHAIEAGIRLKEKYGGLVTILSMGPDQVEDALREALAMGADRAIQLTDRAFAGSDTWATSYTLSLAIKKLGAFDVILCGKEALDGMTAQVGPEIAEQLKIPQLTYAVDIEVNEDKVKVHQILGEYQRCLETKLPVLITVERQSNVPRVAPMDKVIEAYNKAIEIWRSIDLNGDNEQFGLKGSPTKLKKVYTPKVFKGKVEMLSGTNEEIARALVKKLRERCII